jgi:hypothetical protein
MHSLSVNPISVEANITHAFDFMSTTTVPRRLGIVILDGACVLMRGQGILIILLRWGLNRLLLRPPSKPELATNFGEKGRELRRATNLIFNSPFQGSLLTAMSYQYLQKELLYISLVPTKKMLSSHCGVRG